MYGSQWLAGQDHFRITVKTALPRNGVNAMTNPSRSQIKRKQGGTMEDTQREIERQLCPGLAQTGYMVLRKAGDTSFSAAYPSEQQAKMHCDWDIARIVPCLVTPLLTADDRKKLIGEG